MADKSDNPKWRRFEEFVAEIQKQLTPQAQVKHNDVITGKSGVNRQVDVAIRYNLGAVQLLVALDCKDWQHPVDINDVGAFCDQVEDIGANKGGMVCNAGFTSGAKQRAKEKGIDLFRAVDVESKEWGAYMALPTVFDFRGIESFQIKFVHSSPGPFAMPAVDPRYLDVYRKDGSFIDLLGNLLSSAWNSEKLPTEPGDYQDVKFLKEEAYTKVDNQIYGPVDITANLTIDQRLYFGAMPLEKGRGFRNEHSGAFTTNSLTTAGIEWRKVESTWRRIQNINELAVKPAIIFVAFDAYPAIRLPSEL